MADVARQAGVSVSTVSHVVNGTRYTHPDTERRVRQAIARTGFVANPLAQALAGKHTASIGISMSSTASLYFPSMVRALSEIAAASGNGLLIADSLGDPEHELANIVAFHQRGVDGIIISSASAPDSPGMKYLSTRKIPTVGLDYCIPAYFDQVAAENVESAAQVTGHLLDHGHRRIGFIGDPGQVGVTAERVEGYRRTLRSRRIRWNPSLVLEAVPEDLISTNSRLGQLLESRSRPTALIVANNLVTAGLLRALRAHNLSVVKDVAFISFDDFDWADAFLPTISAVNQPVFEIARGAIRMLLERIAGLTVGPRFLRPVGGLITRQSCGCQPMW